MAGRAGRAAEHLGIRDGAHAVIGADRVGADEELFRFAVDHPVGRRAANRFGADDLPEIGGDLVEHVRVVAFGRVGGVGHDPQTTGPGNHRSGAAFALVVEHREMRVDARELDRLGGRCLGLRLLGFRLGSFLWRRSDDGGGNQGERR